MWRSLLVFAVLLVGLTILALCRANEVPTTANYPTASLTSASDQIERGKYLATAADCMPCHTGTGQAPFSGGHILSTAFGTITSPNITSDKTFGIGRWSDLQFYAALHNGIAPGRSWLIFNHYLYPAMPYTAYTKLSYPDVMAIKAYLESLPPSPAPSQPNHLRFPFNQRPTLLAWRLLFFTPGPMPMNPSWDEATKNGAYLTVALGHCGECHTPRNFMQAPIASKDLAGAPIDNLFAPNISSDQHYGIGGWNRQALIDYLHTGNSIASGSAYGAMQTVIQNSTSRLPLSDIADMADYLQHATIPQVTPSLPPVANASASIVRGKALYATYCSICHGADGAGSPQFAPNLAGNGSVTATLPNNVIGAILEGLKGSGVSMPAFGNQLNNQQIADITNYVRTAWGNQGAANTASSQVQKQRKK